MKRCSGSSSSMELYGGGEKYAAGISSGGVSDALPPLWGYHYGEGAGKSSGAADAESGAFLHAEKREIKRGIIPRAAGRLW